MPKRSVLEISPEELVATVEAGRHVQVLDIRAPARVATGRIEIVPDGRFHNILGSKLISMQGPAEIGLTTDEPIAVVCARGNDSRFVANFLNQLGYEAKSVSGGMERWMQTVLPRELGPPPSLDRLVQFDRLGKGALGYLLVSDGEALVVDPSRQPEAYLSAVRDAHAKIVGVADTHVHADYVSGAPALARSLGIPYYLHPADSVYPYDGTPGRLRFESLENGATIRVGRAEVRVVHTPGHTEGSVTFTLGDAAAFTGDFVFIASVGRPDLAGKTNEWTQDLWRSLRRAKDEWPRDIVIYPAHYASERERRSDHAVAGRFAGLLESNPPLRIDSERAFIDWVQKRQGSFPEVYRRIKAINVGLEVVDDAEADFLEMGKNECALS